MRHAHIIKHIENSVIKKYKRNKVRFCLPFTLRCLNCKTFFSKFTRFNTWKETAAKDPKCGLNIFRFIYKCKECHKAHSILTEPTTGQYKTESGCVEISNIQTSKPIGEQRKEDELEQLKEQAMCISQYEVKQTK